MTDTTQSEAQNHKLKGLHDALTDEHASLHRLFEELLAAFQADARVEAGRIWNVFDSRLRAHLAMEEQYLLPAFAAVDAPEAEALRREHDKIRNQLLQLGIGVDLHMTRDQQVEEFIAQLDAHAKREDALMYRFAEQGLKDEEARKMLQRRLFPR